MTESSPIIPFPIAKYERARIIVLAVFVALTLLLVVAWAAIPKIHSQALYVSRDPISIDGNDQFTKKNGVVSGSGTEPDPYVIEGWALSAKNAAGILIQNTDSHVVIRNVTISGLGYYHFYYDGIRLRNASNLIIDNTIVRYADYGIRVEELGKNYSRSIRIVNCTVQFCSSDIYLGNMIDGAIETCELKDSQYPCVVVENCTSINMDGNNIDRRLDNGYFAYYYYSTPASPDVLIQDTLNITLRDNLMYTDRDVARSASIVRCENVTVSGNEFAAHDSLSISSAKNVDLNNNTGTEYSLTGIVNGTVADNIARGYYYYGTPFEFTLVNSASIRFLRNTVALPGGIRMPGLSNAEIAGNAVTNCSNAMSMSGSDVQIRENLFSFDYSGLTVSGDHIDIDANNIVARYGGGTALTASSASWINITQNSIVTGNSSYALLFAMNQNFMIENNRIEGDMKMWDLVEGNITGNEIGPADLDLYGGVWSDVMVVHNTMDNVSVRYQVLAGVPDWNGSYPYGGNYWSEYTGVDQRSGSNQNQPGSDGIGDTPYDIPTYSDTDNYPLMSPVTPMDSSPPMTALFLTGYWGNSGWYRSNVNFTLAAFDNIAGVNTTSYRIDGGSWTPFESKVLVSGEGVHTLEYYSADRAGNSELVQVKMIRIDSQLPQAVEGIETNFNFKNTDIVTIPIEFQDNTSGIRETTLHSSRQFYGQLDYYSIAVDEVQIGLANGTYIYYAGVYDVAGNSNYLAIYINSSLIENRNPTSPGGPYGSLFNYGIYADLFLVGVIIWLTSTITYGPPPKLEPGKEQGEKDRGEVENGYPKYLKRA